MIVCQKTQHSSFKKYHTLNLKFKQIINQENSPHMEMFTKMKVPLEMCERTIPNTLIHSSLTGPVGSWFTASYIPLTAALFCLPFLLRIYH